MRAMETTYKSNTELTGMTTIKIMKRRNLMKRFDNYLESDDWDEKMPAYEKWLNRICLAFIGLSALYFLGGLLLR